MEVPPSPNVYASWNKFTVIELACRGTFEFFGRRLARGSRVAEVGCGNGYLALELAREGHDVTAIDPSDEALAIAKRTLSESTDDDGLGRLDYLCTDFASWRPEGLYDAFVFNLSLHHMDPLFDVIERVHELLRPGGKVLVNDCAAGDIDERWRQWLGAQVDGPHGHPLAFLLSALRGRFEEKYYSPRPYLYITRANALVHDDWTTVKRFYDEEIELLKRGDYEPVGYRWVGVKL